MSRVKNNIMITVFSDVMPCSLVDSYQHLSEEAVAFVVRVEERRYFSTLKVETRGSTETLVHIYRNKRRHIQKETAILISSWYLQISKNYW
jgi:hypothetical protein